MEKQKLKTFFNACDDSIAGEIAENGIGNVVLL